MSHSVSGVSNFALIIGRFYLWVYLDKTLDDNKRKAERRDYQSTRTTLACLLKSDEMALCDF